MAYSSKFTERVLEKNKPSTGTSNYSSHFTRYNLDEDYRKAYDKKRKEEQEARKLKEEQEAKKKEEKKGLDFFSSGAFEDGYQLGDGIKTILGTTADAGVNIIKGAASVGEGIVDLASYGVAGVSDALGFDDFAEKTKKKASKNSVEDFFKPADDFVDKYSVIGETGDAVAQGLGNVGTMILTGGIAGGLGKAGSVLSKVAPTIATTGLSLTSGAGSGMSEAYRGGATDDEALKYGLISGIADAGTELIFGGLGKSINAVGLSKGLSSADDMLAKKVSGMFKNQLTKNLAEYGIKAGAEGIEEVMAGAIQGIGKYVTYQTKEDGFDWQEILKDENLLEQFVVGAVTSGIAQTPGLVRTAVDVKTDDKGKKKVSLKKDSEIRDFITNYTQNEQKVIDTEVNNRTTEIKKQKAVEDRVNQIINEREKTFGTLDATQKKNIKENVMQQLDKGEINFDSVKLNNKEITKIKEEVENNLKSGELDIDTIESILSSEKTTQIKELNEQLGKTTDAQQKSLIQAKINELTNAKNEELRNTLSKDYLLQNSYREANLSKQNFEYEVKETDSEYKKTLAEEFKTKKTNNTTKTHNTFEMLSKMSEDKQTQYHITNNAELKELGYEVDGKDINGLVRVTEDGETRVLVNIDSNKALNRIVGHETTHLLEGTNEYKKLQQLVKEYATTKGDYDTKLESIKKLYKDVSNADIDAEVTSDLVGDYLFTDTDFVNNLSVKEPNIFQKIYNEIKHLYKMATAGSKEARQLEKVKKAFEDAYRKNGVKKEAGIDYAISEKTIQGLEDYSVDEVKQLSKDYIQQKLQENDLYDVTIKDVAIHGSRGRGTARTDSDLDVVVEYEGDIREDDLFSILNEEPMFIDDIQVDINPITESLTDYMKRSNKYDQEVLSKTSLREAPKYDSKGRELTKGQQEYFKDVSQEVKDADGNLQNVYHGSDYAGFTEFGPKNNEGNYKYGDDTISFYTKHKRTAQSYTKSSEMVDTKKLNSIEDAQNWLEIIGLDESVEIQTENGLYIVEDIDNEETISTYKTENELLRNFKRDIQNSLGDPNAGGIYEGYLKITNPYVVDAEGRNWDYVNHYIEPNVEAEYNKIVSDEETKNRLIKLFEESSKKYFEDKNNYKKLSTYFEGNYESITGKLNYITSDQLSLLAQIKFKEKGLGIINLTPVEIIGKKYTTNDIVKQVLEMNENGANYDGVIFKNVIDVGQYGIDKSETNPETTVYVTFNSNQFKAIDNTNPTDDSDIRYSLGNEDIAPSRNDVYGSDIKLQVEEAIAPIKEDIAKLQESLQPITQQVETNLTTEDYSNTLTEEDLPYFEQQYEEDVRNLPELDAPIEVEEYNDVQEVTSSMDDKSIKMLSKNIKKQLGLNKIQTEQFEKNIKELSKDANLTKDDVLKYLEKNFGTYSWKLMNDTIQEAQSELREMKLNVSPIVQSDIRDYYKLKQQNFGKIRFSKEGSGVDQNYQELNGMYPDLFPDDIYGESDQLLRMIEVANMDRYTTINEKVDLQEEAEFIYESILDYRHNDSLAASDKALAEARKYYRNTEAPAEVVDDIAPIKETIVENTAENSAEQQNTAENTAEEKKLSVKEANALKLKNYETSLENMIKTKEQSFRDFNSIIDEKLEQYEELKNKNTQKANNLLQQVNRLKAQRDNTQVEYERRIGNIQTRIEKMNSKEFKTAEQRITKQEQYREQARNLIGDTSKWVDKKMGIQYQINTFKRNLRDIVKGIDGKADINTADAIYEEYQGKYNKNEAKLKVESNKLKQKFMDKKLTNAENVYVQMLGELKYNPTTTLTQDYVDNYYDRNANKIDLDKVNQTIEEARQLYDELFERINETLRSQGMKEMDYKRGYFPHFVEEKQGTLAKLFDWKVKNDQIPTDIAGLTELNNPERSWQSFNKHRTSDITDYNFSKGLDTYVHGALDWIYHIEDIQKRRALENEIRYQHSEEGIKEQIEAIYNDTELDADQVQERIDAILNAAKNPLNNFVTDLRNSTNNLAGKKSTADRSVEYSTNRKIYSVMTNISNRVSGNMIAGSISSALTNFIPITQSWGQVSPISSLNAARETIKNSIKDDGTIAKSTFLTNRLIREENLYKSNWDKAQDKVAIMTDVIDSFTSQVIWRSKYNENIKNGMSEAQAIADADRFAENVIAGRSRGNEPTIFNSKNPFIKPFTAFQLEVANQYGYMFKDMPTDMGDKSTTKLVKGYMTMFVGAYVYNALYSSLVGRDAAFDPIGLLEDILKEFGFGDDEEEDEKNLAEKVISSGEKLVQQVPFVGGLFGGGRLPISAAIPYDNPFETVSGTVTDVIDLFDDEKREEAAKTLLTEWQQPLTYALLPFGGGQIAKTYQGLSMYDDELPVAGSYTNSGDLRFTADESLEGMFKSALFGRWASDSAQEYVDSGFKVVDKDNIQEMKDLEMSSTEYRKYRKGLKDAGTKNEDKLDYIDSLDIPISKKNIMANNLLDRDYDVDMSYYDNYEEFDFSYKQPEKYKWLTENGISYETYSANKKIREGYNWAYENPEKYKLVQQIDTLDNYLTYKEEIAYIKDTFTTDLGYSTKERKGRVQDYINSLDLGKPQKIMLQKVAGGYSIKDYENYMYGYINSLDMTAAEKRELHKQLFD